MERRRPLFSTTVGKKILSALSGLFLSAFLVVHLLGNLTIFPGRGEWINKYGNFLGSLPITIFFEIGLYLLILAHAYMGIRVWRENKLARPQEYARKDWTTRGKITEGPHKSRKSVSSTTMAVSGTLVLLFIVLHTIHFRIGKYNYELQPAQNSSVPALTQGGQITSVPAASTTSIGNTEQGEDLARLLNTAFQNPLIVLGYVLALILTGLHLNHGFASAFQSIGVSGYTKVWAWVGRIFTVVVMGGFIAIPLYIYFFRR